MEGVMEGKKSSALKTLMDSRSGTDTLSARPNPSNSLSRVFRRSKPCTWADYRPVTPIL